MIFAYQKSRIAKFSEQGKFVCLFLQSLSLHMTELIAAIEVKPENRTMNVWEYIIFVSLLIVVMVAICINVFNLFPVRPKYFAGEEVANQTYKSYLERLNTISHNYAKELEAIKKDI